jgi:hypothetical protein
MSAPMTTEPKFGTMYGPGPHYRTTDGTEVWMWRKGQRVRYFDTHGVQVGPEHRNVAPAVVYAAANCWVDPDQPWLSLAVSLEVLGKTRPEPYAVLPGEDLDDALAAELGREALPAALYNIPALRYLTECECSPESHWYETDEGEVRVDCGCDCLACSEY